MIQIAFKIIKIYVVLAGIIIAKSIAPEELGYNEILNIYNKDRDYYRLVDNQLTYFVEGPKILNIYSRLAFPKMSKKINPYEFMIFVDNVDSFKVSHRYRMDSNVTNDMHPGHAYTVSGKDVINIPKGRHRIMLAPLNKSNILIRLTTQLFKKNKGLLYDVEPINNEYIDSKILQTKDSNFKYYSLSNKKNSKVSFDVQGPSVIKVFSRIIFSNKESSGYYHFKVRENNSLLSNQHVITSVSNGSKVLNDQVVKPSKYRTMHILVPEGKNRYELELVSSENKEVLIRIVKEK
ncbi:MAG: hypothetical protein CMG00_03240 [Candidatus Marinimicrobia bacterium]|nr:hypothetical protein [Candidatus Neomarinimicrobiota bacterium]